MDFSNLIVRDEFKALGNSLTMNASEGLRRFAKAIRWLGDGIGILSLLAGISAIFGSGGWFGLSVMLIFAAVISGIGRLISWILLGFVDPTKDS